MDYVRPGTNGLNVSRICLARMTYGSPKWRDWLLDYHRSETVRRSRMGGRINFFDTRMRSWQ